MQDLTILEYIWVIHYFKMKSNNTICMTHPNFVIVVKHKPVEPLTNKNRLKRNVFVFVLPIWEDRNPTAYHKSRTMAALLHR